jgi:hypothetical protein
MRQIEALEEQLQMEEEEDCDDEAYEADEAEEEEEELGMARAVGETDDEAAEAKEDPYSDVRVKVEPDEAAWRSKQMGELRKRWKHLNSQLTEPQIPPWVVDTLETVEVKGEEEQPVSRQKLPIGVGQPLEVEDEEEKPVSRRKHPIGARSPAPVGFGPAKRYRPPPMAGSSSSSRS